MLSCCVFGCKTDEIHKVPNLILHPFPQDEDIKKKWCLKLGNADFKPTGASRVCSLHFVENCFKGSKLKSNAVPTKFFVNWQSAVGAFNSKQKKENKTDVEILTEINKQISKMKLPAEFKQPIGDEKNDVTFDDNTSDTLKLWGIINKQANLIQKLMSSDNKSESMLAKQLEESKAAQKELARKMETFKYITKCLQEKQTTLEEQIEILSAVDSR